MMDVHIGADSLLILPCCAEKQPAGRIVDTYTDPLSPLMPANTYSELMSARRGVLAGIQGEPRFLTNKYTKNRLIREGPDFGYEGVLPQYLTAVERYCGNLYSVDPAFPQTLQKVLQAEDAPQILILSALYGPLHPFSLIQDYNLKMSDRPAIDIWRKSFAVFLKAYIAQNKVQSIRLYLGRTTHYLKVAKAAIAPLIASGLDACFYDVENGNSRETPLNHGKRFLSDLGCLKNAVYSRTIVQDYRIFHS